MDENQQETRTMLRCKWHIFRSADQCRECDVLKIPEMIKEWWKSHGVQLRIAKTQFDNNNEDESEIVLNGDVDNRIGCVNLFHLVQSLFLQQN